MRILLLAVALLVAGCVTPGAAPAEEVGSPSAEGGAVAPGSAAPEDLGHMPHMHDYWLDRERVTLFDGEVAPQTEDPFMTFGGTFSGTVGAATWRLPDGQVVMEGTGRMEIAATYDDPLITDLAVSIRIGPNAPWSDAYALASGKAISLGITPEMTDLPHQTTSRWEFLFHPAGSPGAFAAPFDLRIDIVRLSDIMLFPGHPELFEGASEKVVHDDEHAHTESSYALRVPQLITSGGFEEQFVTPQKLIPMETKAMRMELDILDATSTPGEVTNIRFFYRGANTSYLGHPVILPIEGSLAEGRLIYQVPVAPEETDTPYGNESQWLFFVEPATKFVGEDAEPEMGGMTEVSIQYRLKLIAYDHALDAYSERGN